MKAIVIGAGMGGLSAAIRLRSQGYDVSVFEANGYVGGKLTAFSQGGFRFDAGPSLFTLPHLVDDLFRLANKNPRDYFQYQKLPVTCHYFYEDGTVIHAFADRTKLEKEIEGKLNVPARIIRQYLEKRKLIYETASAIFLENSLHQWSTWWNKKVAQALLKIPQLGIFNTMNEENEKYLKHPHLVQLFNRYATYNGSNPFQAPGILTSIPHLEMNEGAYLPKNGMHDITEALHRLAMDLGVQFHLNQKVESIILNKNTATGVKVDNEVVNGDIVISNMDVYHTYHKLLKEIPDPPSLKQERSSSALIFYWGIDRTFQELDLHNIFFANDYQQEFDCIFRKKVLHHDPTIYVNITSKYCAADAPPGKENWFVMINVPANQNHPWHEWTPQARGYIIQKLNRLLNCNLEDLIVEETILDPITIEARTSSYQGSLYGTSSNNRFAAFLRHPNFSRKISNLYFCGGSVHPGGGIPLALLSGKIVAETISKQFGR